MIEEIQRYTASVKNGTLDCDVDTCPHCGKRPSGFSRHDARPRTFLVIVDGFVHKVRSAITRWRCPWCPRPFTYYPPFALPYKRYVRDTVFEKSARYLEEPEAKSVTYRTAVKERSHAVAYAGTKPDALDERQLSHSTVHRWLATLGGLPRTLRTALGLIKAAAPSSEIFRRILPVAPRKYRTERRREALQGCRRLLQADREYHFLFGVSIFPHLATVCAWE